MDDPAMMSHPKARSFWQEEEDDKYDDGGPGYDQVFYEDEAYEDESDLFEDVLEADESGSVYMCLDEPLPSMMEEDKDLQDAGDLPSQRQQRPRSPIAGATTPKMSASHFFMSDPMRTATTERGTFLSP